VNQEASMESDREWKVRAMLVGGLLGALTGVGAAYLVVRRWESAGVRPRMSTGEGMRLGMLVLGMLREVGRLGDQGPSS